MVRGKFPSSVKLPGSLAWAASSPQVTQRARVQDAPALCPSTGTPAGDSTRGTLALHRALRRNVLTLPPHTTLPERVAGWAGVPVWPLVPVGLACNSHRHGVLAAELGRI